MTLFRTLAYIRLRLLEEVRFPSNFIAKIGCPQTRVDQIDDTHRPGDWCGVLRNLPQDPLSSCLKHSFHHKLPRNWEERHWGGVLGSSKPAMRWRL